MSNDRRIKIAEAVRFSIKRLVEEGCKLRTVDDGGEVSEWIDVREKPQEEIVEDIMAVDNAQLLIENPKGERRWIQFVLCNDPNEIIANYHIDPIIDKVVNEVYEKTY